MMMKIYKYVHIQNLQKLQFGTIMNFILELHLLISKVMEQF